MEDHWHVVEHMVDHWMVTVITISSRTYILEPFVSQASCSLLSVVKWRSKNYFSWLFMIGRVIWWPVIFSGSLLCTRRGKVRNKLIQGRRNSWHCSSMDWVQLKYGVVISSSTKGCKWVTYNQFQGTELCLNLANLFPVPQIIYRV